MMDRVGLLDTGPLLSFLAAGLEHHPWAVEQWKEFRPPFLTCEPLLTEAAFLLKREGRGTDALFALLERRAVRVAISVEEQKADLRTQMRRYRNRPMSLADAWLSEIHAARTFADHPVASGQSAGSAEGIGLELVDGQTALK